MVSIVRWAIKISCFVDFLWMKVVGIKLSTNKSTGIPPGNQGGDSGETTMILKESNLYN